MEDARPPRFANQLGATFLWTATALGAAGLPAASRALGLAVAALALLAAATGFCAGCVAYRAASRLRGVRAGALERVDLAELGGAEGREAVVQFTHPLCADCQSLSSRLSAQGEVPLLVDVSRRPELARKYGIAVVPLAVAVRADGSVARQIH